MSNFSIKEDVKGFHIFLDITGNYMCTTDSIETATAIIEALEKQVAEKPYYLQYCVANREVGNWNHGMACICKKYAKYCSNCGQKLDWRGIK